MSLANYISRNKETNESKFKLLSDEFDIDDIDVKNIQVKQTLTVPIITEIKNEIDNLTEYTSKTTPFISKIKNEINNLKLDINILKNEITCFKTDIINNIKKFELFIYCLIIFIIILLLYKK